MLEEAGDPTMPQKPTTQERLSRHDREIAAIRKLILTGMKMIANLAAGQRELQASQRELQASQRKTDEQLRKTDGQLQDFIRSLRQATNGHAKRKVDLQ
jgi:hypothetical protein